MAYPTVHLNLALGQAPLASSHTWTDFGGRLRTLRISRGRSYILDAFQPGTLTAVLDNQDGYLDNRNPSSPYYGLLRTRTRVQLVAEVLSGTYYLFTGFLRAKLRSYPGMHTDVVELRAEDGFLLLGRTDVSRTFASKQSGAMLAEVLDEIGWPGTGLGPDAHRDIDAGSSLMASAAFERRKAAEPVQLIMESEFGSFFFTGSGQARFISRHALYNDTIYSTSQAIFGDGAGELPYRDITSDDDDNLLYNEVTCTNTANAEVVVEDANSITDYGISTLARTQMLLSTKNELRDMAYHLLARHSNPFQRFPSIECKPQSNDALWDVLLGNDLRTRYTVNKRPPSGYLLSDSVNLEGIDHNADVAHRQWTSVLRLSPADPTQYWRLGTGGQGVLGMNTIPAF